ncbi:hypothetical protein LCGC14_2470620 [marine sediment metagenome]|uniref:Uncharacterized protein n=1 Tax=marine sediment metagenome TaxID=412755 RepID=A0A0F9BB71_9ZZZZ
MKTPRQIAQEYAGVALVDALEKEIEKYGEDQYRDGHGTGYGKGKRDGTIMTKRGY